MEATISDLIRHEQKEIKKRADSILELLAYDYKDGEKPLKERFDKINGQLAQTYSALMEAQKAIDELNYLSN